MTEAERTALKTAGAAAFARAEVYEKLKTRLPAAMLARSVDASRDGTLLKLFRTGMLRAEDRGLIGDEARAQALLYVLTEQSTEVQVVLSGQERESRDFAIYVKGRLDESAEDEGAPAPVQEPPAQAHTSIG